MSAVQGPLGIWPFPLINLLMSLVQSKGRTQRPLLPAPAGGAIVTNTETCSWDDWRGRTRSMSIKREIK